VSIQRAQEDAWTKESAKWEQRDVMIGGTFVQAIPYTDGGKKDVPRTEYPKMLYRGESAPGGPRIAGKKIVQSEGEELLAHGQGWHAKQEDALAAVTAQELEYAKLAANRVHNEQWMSEKAKAEAQRVDESTMRHVPVIPETPITRRVRRTKAQMAAAKG
jgi:hypothetical protein